MSYIIDKSLFWDNLIFFTTEQDTKYSIKLKETSLNSGLWTIDFRLLRGNPSESEVFKTIGNLYDILTEKDGLLEKNNVRQILVFIEGKNKEEINLKTKIFTRWIKSPWQYKIEYNPDIIIHGGLNIQSDKNSILITKLNNIDSMYEIKYCLNCGEKNNHFKFCPNCGQSLTKEKSIF